MTQVPDIQETSEETKPKSRTGALIAAIGTVVTVTVLGVTGYNYISNRPSSVETLVVREVRTEVEQSEEATLPDEPTEEVAAEEDEQLRIVGEQKQSQSMEDQLAWQVPVTAPLSTFPTDLVANEGGTFDGCSEAQLAWLREYGTQGSYLGGSDIGAAFSLLVSNEASEGAALSLGNIRFDGSEIPADPVVSFHCPSGGRGDGLIQRIIVGVDGQPAVFGEGLSAYQGQEAFPPGAPATINVKPGEILPVVILRDASVDVSRQYEGKLLAEVLDGSGETVVLLDHMEFKRAPELGFLIGYRSGFGDDVFVCRSGEGITWDTPWQEYPVPEPCTLEEAATMLRSLGSTSTP
ncbi:MAG: hypothetical protein WAS54_09400 [Scrofimicrobium sp.]